MGLLTKRVVIITIVLVIYYQIIFSTRCSNLTNQVSKVKHTLKLTLQQLEKMKQWNKKLLRQIREKEDEMKMADQYRNLIRRIYSNTKELWYFVSYHLREAVSKDLSPKKIQILLQEVAERKRSLLVDQEKLPTLDGYQEWRRREAASVSDLVQRRLRYLQNPPDCQNARKLICEHQNCGFGCGHHHLVHCLESAYASGKTLVVLHISWPYRRTIEKMWTELFQDLSGTCVEFDIAMLEGLLKNKSNYLDDKSNLEWKEFSPMTIPDDLALRIVRFNGDPSSWWIGQLLKYVLKPLRHVQATINLTMAGMNITPPIVGVHIRRTDKLIREAKFYDVSRYMFHVEEYYEQLELMHPVDVRRVYLATDDVKVFREAVSKYPRYKFYGEMLRAKSAAPHLRNTWQGLIGLLVDLYMLSSCNYVVCTLSSNIGRMVYELMQANQDDASNSIHSLDSQHYFHIKDDCYHTAVMHNKGSPQSIPLHVGDIIKNRCKKRSRKGTIIGTNLSGSIPWYKTARRFVKYPFPKYVEMV